MNKYFIATMSGAQWLGNMSILRLLKFFKNDAKAAWSAEKTELKKAGLTRNAVESFVDFRSTHYDAPERLADYCYRKRFGLCSYVDEDYPPILREISSPPAFFYYRGTIQPFVERIAIVGTRHNTDYGQKVALELAENLTATGLTIVSGAARGIDTFAHRGALKHGRTVAVLGYGLNWVYPRENKKLLEQIAENGLVMSEFHPNFEANEGTFPQRNRIISGLCRGVIVVEAGQKSGALNTAQWAADDSRDVFCVPGRIYSEMSVGCHALIRDGARLIRNAWDVLDFYDFDMLKLSLQKNSSLQENISKQKILPVPKTPPVELDGVNAKIFELIPADAFITEDEILDRVDDVAPHELPQILLELELKNCIVENAGRYTRKFS